jgi:formamidopyrimidine-DNA glycosylase
MPELPEVENTRRYLVDAGLPGKTFTGAEIGWSKTVKSPSVDTFVSGIKGGRVRDVKRRAKYILIPLSRGGSRIAPTLIIHLGMTGGLRVQHASQPAHPMLRHTFTLDDGSQLRFIDGRKFGKLWLTDNPDEVLPVLGPEPLGYGFTLEGLALSFRGRNAPVKALLLEQSIVAGMGNIYADESLLLAGIHPLRPASQLSLEDILRLKDSIVSALSEAVQEYEQSRNEGWPDPPMSLTAWSIPRKNGGPCPRCDGPISVIRVRGRGTCFCPQCQG